MSGKDDNLMRRLRETFKVEAREHIQSIAAGLLDRERTAIVEAQAGPAEWMQRWRKLRPDLRIVRHALENKKNSNGGGPASAPTMQWLRMLEFLDWNQNFVESLDIGLRELAKTADHHQRSVGTMVDTLLDDMKKVVMQPFSTLLDVFPRFVRELSRDEGKEVELLIHGAAIEIDRRVLAVADLTESAI